MAKGTIQQSIDDGETIEVWCNTCHHHQKLDLLKLRDKLGPDHGSMHDDIAHLFRCSKCGGKKIGLIFSPNVAKIDADRVAGKNLYQKAKGG